jgi:hypothetical protein
MIFDKDKLPAISGYAHSIEKARWREVFSWFIGLRSLFRISLSS